MEAERSLETSAHNARGLGNCRVRNAMVTDIIHVRIAMAEVTSVTAVIIAIVSIAVVVMAVTTYRLDINLPVLNAKGKNTCLCHVQIPIVTMA